MELIITDQNLKCFHCGDECDSSVIHFDHRQFCCQGCKSVYDILKSSNLTTYYELESTPGTRFRSADQNKFDYLENTEVSLRLLDFSSENLEKVRFLVPGIHCTSCVWLLENLRQLNTGVLWSRANLSDRELAVDYDPRVLTLKGLVELLAAIGYEPAINLEKHKSNANRAVRRSLILKIAVAGFCFGNIMLLSFPEYMGLDFRSDPQLSWWFSRLTMVLSLPVLFYCAGDYFKSAFRSIRQNFLNIDVPIVLGVMALAGRSYYEILMDIGPGYLDSLAGLLFLLLIGKWFQNTTYTGLSFNRDFKSYFPLAITRKNESGERTVLVEELQPGDIILLRDQELIPADSVLLDARCSIDYSFVSGESGKLQKYQGDHIYAGGRHIGLISRYQVVKPVSQSYLTQLWNHQAFSKSKQDPRELLINRISKYFTVALLLIAMVSAAYWMTLDPGKAVFVFASVLIVACPCALSMATPFTLGNVMKVMGKNKLYLKNSQVVNRMAEIGTLVFDKTGTLTKPTDQMASSVELSRKQARLLYALTRHSNHPTSREVHAYLKNKYHLNGEQLQISDFKDKAGIGVSANVDNHKVQLGSADLVNCPSGLEATGTFYALNHKIIGTFTRRSTFREGLSALFSKLHPSFRLMLLSGDGDQDRPAILEKYPQFESLKFRQTPQAKLDFIETLEMKGQSVMMLGDGLNDAGAIQSSSVGLAVTEQPHNFTPASDGILHASSITKLLAFLQISKWAQWIILMGFGLSFLYNAIGLSFAVTGHLTPLFAAVLMPLSSLTVMLFSTMAVKLVAKRLDL